MCAFERLRKNDIMDEQEAQALTRAYTTLVRDELHHLPCRNSRPRRLTALPVNATR
ncbi:hypothetical protein KIF59_16325 [Enterobacter cloacae subsp. cloacae]|nr:hypothetical protein [Enterobacter cloacae subsp. cloacae]